jgi:transketolase
MPCLEYFGKQPETYRDAVLPPGIPVVAIEAGSPQSWDGLVGKDGAIIGIERFGASAPYQRIYKEFGLTVENLVGQAKRVIG